MKKVYTIQQAYVKASKYCAYQERSQQEVRERLHQYGIYGEEAEEVICRLIEDNFINEARFACTFAGGKFRLKKWGKLKIEQGLRQKGVSEACIRLGLQTIEEEDYQYTLENLLKQKAAYLKEENLLIFRQKLAQYVIRKGYESHLVWASLRVLFPEP